MTPVVDLQLANKYPKIFKYYARSHIERPQGETWGFECGDGWQELLDVLCGCIQHRIDWKIKSLGPEEAEALQVVAFVVKEKFGGLRFDYLGGDEEIRGMVTMAESMSYRTCESCGLPGTRKGEGWVFTMCDPCWKKREEERSTK